MTNIILYTTAGCHLCELAKEVLWPLLNEFQLRLIQIDIADSDLLIERYGMRIPVLATAIDAEANSAAKFNERCNSEELGWPFTTMEARAFIERVI